MTSKFQLGQDYKIKLDGVYEEFRVGIVGIMLIAGVPDYSPIEEWINHIENFEERREIEEGIWIAIQDIHGEIAYVPESAITIIK